MSSLGKELREERERRAVSLKDISAQTKIGLWMLEALENDRLDLLPGPFFIKGVIRAYARTIGADEKRFLGLYQSAAEPRPAAPSAPVPAPPAPVRRRGRPWLWAALPLLLAAAVFAIVSTRSARSRTERPAVDTLAQPIPASLTATPPPFTPPKAPLRLEMSFTEDTWLQVVADGIMVLDGLKTAGQTARFTARDKILIHTGNAGGFTFRLNDRPGKRLGGPGEVVKDVGITPQNLVAYQLPPDILAAGEGGSPR
jgi:hypothetical protein